jgi:hypothetical protein
VVIRQLARLADDLYSFNKDRAGAVPKLPALSLVETYSAHDSDGERSPGRLRSSRALGPSSPRVQLVTGSPKALDRSSVSGRKEVGSIRPALLEPAVLKVREPCARERHPRSEGHAFHGHTASSVGRLQGQSKRSQLPHHFKLLLILTSAMGWQADVANVGLDRHQYQNANGARQ